MDTKIIVSSKGQVVIPKYMRENMGLHFGSELRLYLRDDHVLELQPIQRNITQFFGQGAARSISYIDVDQAIEKAVYDNNLDK